MPIKIPSHLPAKDILEGEKIFIMDEGRATEQDIRPLKIAVMNLMPTKIVTETQLIRLLSNTPLQVELTLLKTATYESVNTPPEHMKAFYKTFDEVKHNKFDGLIITGAPVENLPFNDVHYWRELCEVMDWSLNHVYSTMYICWAAQAGLYHHFGVNKFQLPEKLSGVYEHKVLLPYHPLVRGFNETFMAPHSRYTGVRTEDVKRAGVLDIVSDSERAGLYLAASRDGRMVFITGHAEYDKETLALEYRRDCARGINPRIPENYFPQNDPEREPQNTWRSHAHLLFSNWLNYFVYQQTPYDIEKIGD